MTGHQTYPLIGIVTALRDAGLQASVGDLLDGIEALTVLDTPFEALEPVATSHRDRAAGAAGKRQVRREQLIWLIQTLWARSDEERDTVRRVLGRAIAPVPPRYALKLGQAVAGLPVISLDPVPEAPRPPPEDTPEDLRAKAKARAAEAEQASKEDTDDALSPEPLSTYAPQTAPPVRVSVPIIEDDALPVGHMFQMSDPPALDELALSNIWRRFRRPRYYPDPRRIDAEKSVEATIRAGGELTIARAMRRVNQAQLTLMLDASSSMAPWGHWRRLLAVTVLPEVSRLDAAEIGYFATAPGETWYSTPELTPDPEKGKWPMEKRLKALAGRPMLVFGEAGAARAPMRNAPDRLAAFLALTLHNDIRPLIWINPMRKVRWQPFFRAAIDAAPHAEAYTLSHTALVTAIDRMREEAR